MKILYIDSPKKRDGYPYYTDLYRSLCKLAEVSLVRCERFSTSLPDSADVIILGLGWMSQNNPKVYQISGLKKLKIPIICILHKPQTFLDLKLRFCKENVHLLVYSQKEHKQYGKIAGIPSLWSWMAGDHEIYKDRPVQKDYDFGFSGALHGRNKIKGPTQNLRTRIYDLVKARPDLKLFWNGSDSIAPRIRSIKEYAQKINQCKIWLATTGPLEDVGPRYFEIGLSKTLLFCNRMDYNGVFRDGENCVMFENDLSDFDKNLSYYLRAEDKRQVIIERAYDEFRSIHTWDHRAKKLLSELKKRYLNPGEP